MAEEKGLKVGDRIVCVNGKSFDEITHADAVELIKNHSHLSMKVQVFGNF